MEENLNTPLEIVKAMLFCISLAIKKQNIKRSIISSLNAIRHRTRYFDRIEKLATKTKKELIF